MRWKKKDFSRWQRGFAFIPVLTDEGEFLWLERFWFKNGRFGWSEVTGRKPSEA